uniref:Uncharacterized protein n=1 Tax=Haemonchus contortus TaxID=6289 RepID=A0A912LM81_HAECO
MKRLQVSIVIIPQSLTISDYQHLSRAFVESSNPPVCPPVCLLACLPTSPPVCLFSCHVIRICL